MNTLPSFLVFQYQTLLWYRYCWIIVGAPILIWLLLNFGYFPGEHSARNPWNLLICSPLMLMYSYAKKSFKQKLCLEEHQISVEELIIPFNDIASYCTTVRESRQQGNCYLVRITLKNQQTHIFEMPAGSFRTLRKWFITRGLRAKRTEQDRKLEAFYENEGGWRAIAAIIYFILLMLLLVLITQGPAAFKL